MYFNVIILKILIKCTNKKQHQNLFAHQVTWYEKSQTVKNVKQWPAECQYSGITELQLIIRFNTKSLTWSSETLGASCDNIPATKASPAPVVSTASTFRPLTRPLKSCFASFKQLQRIYFFSLFHTQRKTGKSIGVQLSAS